MHDVACRFGPSTMRRYETRHGHNRTETHFICHSPVLYINLFLYQRLGHNNNMAYEALGKGKKPGLSQA